MMGTSIKRFLSACAAGAFLAFGSTPAQDILFGVEASPGSLSGAVLAPTGDLDGDGVADFLVGLPADDSGGTGAGAAWALSGLDGSLIHVWLGQPGEAFGTSVAFAGDPDLDGFADVIIGAPGLGAGAARVYSGLDGSLLVTLAGVQTGGDFGRSVASVADHDGDGLPDFVVGAPREDTAGLVDGGVVRIFSGADGTVLLVIAGDDEGDELGLSMQGQLPGTVLGDMDPGLIIGATQGSGLRRGYVLVRHGAGLGEGFRFDGLDFDHAGTSVAAIGDVNGDGVGEFAIGTAPTTSAGVLEGAGLVRVVSGSDGTVVYTVYGSHQATGFGSVVAAIGDADGDGVPDFAIGEPLSDEAADDAGSMHLVSGLDGAPIGIVHGAMAGGRLGASLAAASDLDLDGGADLVVGVPGAALVVVLSFSSWDSEASGVAGVTGIPQLRGVGKPTASGETSFNLTNAAPLAQADLVIGHALVLDPSGGVMVPFEDIVVAGLTTDALGRLSEVVPWSEELLPGTLIYAQVRVDDAVAPLGAARSNTVARTAE